MFTLRRRLGSLDGSRSGSSATSCTPGWPARTSSPSADGRPGHGVRSADAAPAGDRGAGLPGRGRRSIGSTRPTWSTYCACSRSGCGRPSSPRCASTPAATRSTSRRLRPGQLVMHPGPVNRGIELSAAAIDSPQALIGEQVKAGVAVRMAVLYELLVGLAAAGGGGMSPACSAGERPRADLLIRGAQVLDPRTELDDPHDVLIRDGQIAELGAAGSLPAPDDGEAFDATGKHVFPAFVDPHVHLRTPGPGVQGGHRHRHRGRRRRRVLRRDRDAQHRPRGRRGRVLGSLAERARREARVPVGFLAAITRGLAGTELTEMADLRDAGRARLHRRRQAGGLGRHAAQGAGQYQRLCGGVIALHEEDPTLSGDGVMHEGAVSARLGMAGIPSISESTMVARDARAGRLRGRARPLPAPVRGRVGPGGGGRPRPAGSRVSAEVTPAPPDADRRHGPDAGQPLQDEPAAARRPRPAGPGRRHCVSGVIDCVATDHAPHARHEKEVPFEQASMGTHRARDGVRRPVHRAGAPGRAELEVVVERMSAGAALYGLPTPADRARPAGQPVRGRSRRPLGGRRPGLRQPLGELLLPRPHAPRPGGAHRRRRRGRLPRARCCVAGG